MRGGEVSLVMQPLRAHHVAHEAEEYPAMSESTTDTRIVPLPTSQDVLTDLLRDGARRMLAQAIEAEVAAYVAAPARLKHQRILLANSARPRGPGFTPSQVDPSCLKPSR